MAVIDILRNEGDFIEYNTGDVVFKEGDASDGKLFYVLEGRVSVTVQGKHFHDIEQGGVVGEMGLIDDGPRSALVKAEEPSKLIKIDQKRFNFLIQHTPFFAIQVMRILVDRLREATELGVDYLK